MLHHSWFIPIPQSCIHHSPIFTLYSLHTSSPNISTVNQLNSGVALIEYNIIHFTLSCESIVGISK